jgi:hypothetical protein
MKYAYSKEAESIMRSALVQASENKRVIINEWRNFIDYDLIPLIIKINDKENLNPSDK